MTRPKNHTESTQRKKKAPLSPEDELRQQKSRASILTIILTVMIIAQALFLIGGLIMTGLATSSAPTEASPETIEKVRNLAPLLRLMSGYALGALIFLILSLRTVRQKSQKSFMYTLIAAFWLLLEFPLGTLAALFLFFMLPPRQWLDLRPQAQPTN